MKKKIFLGEKGKLDSDIYEFMQKHRLRVLSKFIDNNFVDAEDFRTTIIRVMTATIKVQIMDALDKEYNIKDIGDGAINKLVSNKIETIIKKVWE